MKNKALWLLTVFLALAIAGVVNFPWGGHWPN